MTLKLTEMLELYVQLETLDKYKTEERYQSSVLSSCHSGIIVKLIRTTFQ